MHSTLDVLRNAILLNKMWWWRWAWDWRRWRLVRLFSLYLLLPTSSRRTDLLRPKTTFCYQKNWFIVEMGYKKIATANSCCQWNQTAAANIKILLNRTVDQWSMGKREVSSVLFSCYIQHWQNILQPNNFFANFGRKNRTEKLTGTEQNCWPMTNKQNWLTSKIR